MRARVDTRALLWLLALLWSPVLWAEERGFVAQQIEAFRGSDFNVKRADSNVPFAPLAFIGSSTYGKAEVVEDERGIDATYDLYAVHQGAFVPYILGQRDMIGIGEYVSFAEFSITDGTVDNFEVTSVGIPMGWARQVNPQWQALSFIMPMGHHNSLDNGGWTWQTLGGLFTRWEQTERLWWAFGLYFDLGPEESFALPYLGASIQLNEAWTISAILPWPSLNYAPNDKWLFRFGASPSQASWSISPKDGNASLNLDAFDFGLAAEHKLSQLFWVGAEAGVGGLRNLRVSDDDYEDPDFDVGSSWYFNLSLRIRPPKMGP